MNEDPLQMDERDVSQSTCICAQPRDDFDLSSHFDFQAIHPPEANNESNPPTTNLATDLFTCEGVCVIRKNFLIINPNVYKVRYEVLLGCESRWQEVTRIQMGRENHFLQQQPQVPLALRCVSVGMMPGENVVIQTVSGFKVELRKRCASDEWLYECLFYNEGMYQRGCERFYIKKLDDEALVYVAKEFNV